MTPATPAAAWVWPMLDLTEPSARGRWRSAPYVAWSAPASIGSPSRVPVPCASTASTSAADSRASASACRMTASWAGPFGAARPLLAPSWLDGAAAQHGEYGMPRFQGLGEGFEEQRAGAFGEAEPSALGRERVCTGRRRRGRAAY